MSGYREDWIFLRHCIIALMAFITVTAAIALLPFPAGAKEIETDRDERIITWSGEKIIAVDFDVDIGDILVIEPGSVITFKNSANLNVFGTLNASGLRDRPITITGGLTGDFLPRPESEIVFQGAGEDTSRMENCSVTRMKICIRESSPTISNNIITENSLIDISGFCTPVIDRNILQNNGVGTPRQPWYPEPYKTESFSSSSGPTLQITCGSTAMISSNIITRNGGYGIDIASASPTVVGNTISGNRWGGIFVQDCWEGYISAPTIRHNFITGHGNASASSAPPRGREVFPSVFFTAGIWVDNADCYFFDNRITDNDIGIHVSQDLTGKPELNGDILVNNTIGSYSYCGSPVFNNCRLDNHAYDFWVEVYSHVETYNTTFDRNKIMVLGESTLRTEHKTYYPAAAGLGIFGLLLVLFVAATETGKYKLFAIFVPLYSRLKRKDILNQFVRGQIYGLVRGEPGIHYSKIKRVLALGNGTLAHHLAVLEREGFIRSKQRRLRKLFYPAEIPDRFKEIAPETGAVNAAEDGIELSDVQARILEIIKAEPGIVQAAIAEKTEIPKQTVSYNIKSLSRTGFIDLEKDGNKIRCYCRDEIED